MSLSIAAGETLGLVGESGCGKSTLGRSLLRLIDADAGSVAFAGSDVKRLTGRTLRRFRQGAQIIFQNADSSLNSRLSVDEAIARPLRLFDASAPAERTAGYSKSWIWCSYHARTAPVTPSSSAAGSGSAPRSLGRSNDQSR